MNQISIKSSAHNTPEVKLRRKIARTGNTKKNLRKKFVFILKFRSVTYLDFLHTHIIHNGTNYNKKVSGKVI